MMEHASRPIVGLDNAWKFLVERGIGVPEPVIAREREAVLEHLQRTMHFGKAPDAVHTRLNHEQRIKALRESLHAIATPDAFARCVSREDVEEMMKDFSERYCRDENGNREHLQPMQIMRGSAAELVGHVALQCMAESLSGQGIDLLTSKAGDVLEFPTFALRFTSRHNVEVFRSAQAVRSGEFSMAEYDAVVLDGPHAESVTLVDFSNSMALVEGAKRQRDVLGLDRKRERIASALKNPLDTVCKLHVVFCDSRAAAGRQELSGKNGCSIMTVPLRPFVRHVASSADVAMNVKGDPYSAFLRELICRPWDTWKRASA